MMHLLQLLRGPTLLFMLIVIHQGQCMDENIEGGHDAKPHSRPYMVYIVTLKPGHSKYTSCDGFLVREDFVMSAAHCKGKPMFVFTGVHNRGEDLTNNSKVEAEPHAHPGYNGEATNHANDIMLLKLSHNVGLNEWVKVLGLPQIANEPAPTDNCLVPGWGRTSFPNGTRPRILQEVNVTIDSSIDCERNKICSQGSKGPLEGDSGGPLICGDVAYGVVSTHVPAKQRHYYTEISHYHEWIEKTIAMHAK